LRDVIAYRGEPISGEVGRVFDSRDETTKFYVRFLGRTSVSATKNDGVFSVALRQSPDDNNNGLVDSAVSNEIKSGFRFTYRACEKNRYIHRVHNTAKHQISVTQ